MKNVMKKRIVLLCTVVMLGLCSFAQETMAVVNPNALKFAYLSYEEALQTMPGYKLAQQSLSDLRAQYEAEQKRVEQDFNMKYEEFLEGQRDFPETILRKRQTELKELETESHVYISLKVKVNTELKMLLFSYNDAIEVIEPLWFRNEFAESVKKMGAGVIFRG